MSDSERSLEQVIAAAEGDARGTPSGPPPLRPFGLVLHHDGHFTHEGAPIRNRKLRERFDRSVVYLPEEDKFVIEIGRFRGEIEVEEAGFFVREVDLEAGLVRLSDGEDAALEVATLSSSPIDGALLCRVKRDLTDEGLLARFSHAAQAELLAAVEETEGGFAVRIAGVAQRLPDL